MQTDSGIDLCRGGLEKETMMVGDMGKEIEMRMEDRDDRGQERYGI